MNPCSQNATAAHRLSRYALNAAAQVEHAVGIARRGAEAGAIEILAAIETSEIVAVAPFPGVLGAVVVARDGDRRRGRQHFGRRRGRLRTGRPAGPRAVTADLVVDVLVRGIPRTRGDGITALLRAVRFPSAFQKHPTRAVGIEVFDELAVAVHAVFARRDVDERVTRTVRVVAALRAEPAVGIAPAAAPATRDHRRRQHRHQDQQQPERAILPNPPRRSTHAVFLACSIRELNHGGRCRVPSPQ